MHIESIVTQLKEELGRIENAIAALAELGSHPVPRRGRPPQAQKKRTMSPAARKRISAAMKRRWANWKRKSAPKQGKAKPTKTTVRRPMSAAAKKKL